MVPCRGSDDRRCPLKRSIAVLCLLALAAPAVPAEERIDLDVLGRIRTEGLYHSQVMDIAWELTDRIGPRLTGSPQMKAANDWTRQQLADWGLSGARLETWGPFGRGWTYEECAVRMTAPDAEQLIALPEAWTGGTAGTIRAKAVRVNAKSKDEIDKFKGKLAGKIVFLGEARELKLREKPDSERLSDTELAELAQFEMPGGPPRYDRADFIRRREIKRAAEKLANEEKALAIVSAARGDFGTLNVQGGGTWKKGDPEGLPSLAMAPEHFARVSRLLERGVDVELELDVKTRFIEEDLMQWNTVAELPGTDKKDEVVMIGAHLDSWHGATGATDNAAGSAVAMEAMRILKTIGVKPRRTIRIGLWSGEEQALYGSRAYVKEHFATRPEPPPEDREKPFYLRKKTWPITTRPEHAKLSAYFNMDNGGGKIRGIYAEENAAAVPIFKEWIAPLADLGVSVVTMNGTGNTDHEAFEEVGLPGFQFIQDGLEYGSRTHHSNMDVYDRLQKNDLMQAAVVMATFAYNAAMREARMPRKPMPKEETEKKKIVKEAPETPAAPPPTPAPGP